MNHSFMIIRQILRLVVYYLMPLVSVSIFYSLIAQHLFQTKGVIQSSNSSIRSLRNEPTYVEPRALIVRLNSTFRSKQPSTLIQAARKKMITDAKIRNPLRARHKLAKTVLFLCLVFFICWLPKQIHDLYWFVVLCCFLAKNSASFFQVHRCFGLFGQMELLLADQQNGGSRSLQYLLMHQPFCHLFPLFNIPSFLQAISVLLVTDQVSTRTTLDPI